MNPWFWIFNSVFWTRIQNPQSWMQGCDFRIYKAFQNKVFSFIKCSGKQQKDPSRNFSFNMFSSFICLRSQNKLLCKNETFRSFFLLSRIYRGFQQKNLFCAKKTFKSFFFYHSFPAEIGKTKLISQKIFQKWIFLLF